MAPPCREGSGSRVHCGMGSSALWRTLGTGACWTVRFARVRFEDLFDDLESQLEIPLLGAVPIASAFLFDIGVFALVVGATVLMLIAIAHQSMRSHRAPRAPLANESNIEMR